MTKLSRKRRTAKRRPIFPPAQFGICSRSMFSLRSRAREAVAFASTTALRPRLLTKKCACRYRGVSPESASGGRPPPLGRSGLFGGRLQGGERGAGGDFLRNFLRWSGAGA